MDNKILNSKILLVIISALAIFLGFFYFYFSLEIQEEQKKIVFPVSPVNKKIKNPTINNPQADFRGTNIGDSVYFNWAPAERAKEYVRFRAYSLEGPWEEDARIPGSLTNSIDITAEAREKTLCYYLEARDEKENVVKSYKPICVPKYEE